MGHLLTHERKGYGQIRNFLKVGYGSRSKTHRKVRIKKFRIHNTAYINYNFNYIEGLGKKSVAVKIENPGALVYFSWVYIL
jgi:hypothetical protein